MRIERHRRVSRFLAGGVALGFVLWASYLVAWPDGDTGDAQRTNGCSCHSTTPNANGPVTVSITGPQAVRPGTTNAFSISVSGGPAATTGGFDLEPTAGSLIAGPNTRVASGELTQSNPDERSWNFQWTAPATEGQVNFYAVGQGTNGDGGTDGDSWNWYGGAVNTPFSILVSSLVGVDEGPEELWLAPPSPNPSIGSMRIPFSLAHEGTVRSEVFDPSGRRIALLYSGWLSSGPHELTWDGRSDKGQTIKAGVYLIRLETGGHVLTRSIVRTSR